jgi:hypothetical protein
MSSETEQVVTDFLTTGAKCHGIPCTDMLDGSAEPSPRESAPVPESSPCSDDINPFELASLWERFSALSLNVAASERQGEERKIDISAKDAKDADEVDTSKLKYENYGEGLIRSVGPEACDDGDSSHVVRAGDGAEKNVANMPSSGQGQSVRGRKLPARYVGVLISPQEDAAKENQPLKKSSVVQKQPTKTILAGSTNQAPIIVTIEDLDYLYNDFINGEVVEDDGNPKLVSSSSNQDSTAHELIRGEMPVGFGEEVRSQPQIAVKQRRNKAKLEMAAMGREHASHAKRKAETEKFDHQLAEGHARKRSKKQEGDFRGTDADTSTEVEVADCGEDDEGAQKIPSKHGRDAGAALSTGTMKIKRARFLQQLFANQANKATHFPKLSKLLR